MKKIYRHRARLAALTLGLAATPPAEAQFMAPGGFPLIVVPPPPAQSIVIPRKPKPAPTPASPPPSEPSERSQVTCSYHGQTRICE